jgi:quaternary ammonium compound-resistance protein SugE
MIAGVIEVCFTTAIRYTDGFTKLWPSMLVLALAAVSFYCIAKATATIPLGTAYAFWGGLGAVGTVIIGILYFEEPVTFWRMFFLSMLIISLAGLKFVTD